MSEEKSKERLIFEEKIEKLKSRLDRENLEKNIIEGNYEQCPHCKKQTLVENRNLVNE